MIPVNTPIGRRLISRSESRITATDEQTGTAVYCTACGKRNNSGDTYCFGCGQKLRTEVPLESTANGPNKGGLTAKPDSRYQAPKEETGLSKSERLRPKTAGEWIVLIFLAWLIILGIVAVVTSIG